MGCFQFRQSEGLFEFREDQMQLDHGFLQLIFRSYDCQQGRVVRFPTLHFSLTATDTDPHWEYLGEEAEPEGEEEEAKVVADADFCNAYGPPAPPAVASPRQCGG